MKKILFVYIVILITNMMLNAQTGWRLKAGMNYSTFYDENDNGWLPGVSISINKYWDITYGFKISTEINYIQKGGIIKNKLYGPFFPDLPQRLGFFDVNALVDYLQIPLFIEYGLAEKWNLDCEIFTGFFIAIPVIDRSDLKGRKDYIDYNPDNLEHRNYPYEYYDNDWPGFGISNELYKLNKGIEFGLRINYKKYFLEINYMRDFEIYGFVDMITVINKKTHLMNLLIGIKLK